MFKRQAWPVLLLLLCSSATSLAAGKKRQEADGPKLMKRAVAIDPIEASGDRYIELPDPTDPLRFYGENIYIDLVDQMQRTGDFAILVGGDEPQITPKSGLAMQSMGLSQPDPCIINSPAVASSRLTMKINELSFAVGSRANRVLYGFLRGGENPYNSGTDVNRRNEFPPKKGEFDRGWFGSTFDNSESLHTGLSLGNEVNFDVLLVGASLKHTEYFASMGLDISFQNRFGRSEHRQITARGHGFYFDFSGHFNYYGSDISAGIMLARKAALLEAFNKVISASVQAISNDISAMPLIAKLATNCGGDFFISVGDNYRIQPGQRFYDLSQFRFGQKPAVFTVQEVFQRSAKVHVDGTGFSLNDELVSLNANEVPPQPKAIASQGMAISSLGSDAEHALETAQNIDVGRNDIDLPKELAQYVENVFTRFAKGIVQLVTLPYQIWRYFHYDQEFKGGEIWEVGIDQATKLAANLWPLQSMGAPLAWRQAGTLGSRSVIVAVIDTGIDYNHRELRRNIYWDGRRNFPGWDFVSADARPYDDHAHGTEIASVIAGGGAKLVGVAPNVTLLPVKAFNPYGETSSGAIYSAFEFAIANGAKVIVIGWSTKRQSQALNDALRLAAMNGVLVVVSAGDDGESLQRSPAYPAAYAATYPANMLVVAGYGKDLSLTRTNGHASNYGSPVDIAAPGDQIQVANPRDNYESRSHTGLAAGYVAGAAAIAYSRCPKISALEVKTAILNGAQTLDALRGEVPRNRALSLPGMMAALQAVCK